jgi:molybdopterin converting factor small subunit
VYKVTTVRVTLKLFATYRRHLPPGSVGNACELHAPAGTPVSDLLARFGVPHEPGASVILVNGRDVSPEQMLEAGDTIAVFPAMAGG